ncbi:hypothetical protein SDJN02_26654, partial [Cucurbita argyrosperma subsp. argyrosperma]
MSETGLPQFLMAACEASMAMSVTALLHISSLCFMVAWPSIASSGYFFSISSDITTYLVLTVVVLPMDLQYRMTVNSVKMRTRILEIAIDQVVLRDKLGREGLPKCQDRSSTRVGLSHVHHRRESYSKRELQIRFKEN